MANGNSEKLNKGDVLFVQGETPRGLYSLQSGSMEILSASDEFNGLDRNIVLSKSRRVGIISGSTFIAGLNANLIDPYKKSVRAISDCVITKFPLTNGGMMGLATSDVGLAANLLRQFYSSLNSFSANNAKYRKLYLTASMISDNIALMYKEMSETNAPEKLHALASDLHNRFVTAGGKFPSSFNAQFLVTNNSGFLNKRYELPDVLAETSEGKKLDELILKFLQLEPSALQSLLKTDPTIAVNIYESLTVSFMRLLNRSETMTGYINKVLNTIFGVSDSWTFYLVDSGGFLEWSNSGKFSPDFIKNFLSLLVKINALYEELTGLKMTGLFPGIRGIHEFYTAGRSAPAAQESQRSEATAVVPSGAMARSMHQIFEFALVQKDFKNKFIKLLNEFKNMKNPFSTESDGRKLRRHIGKFYWELYQQVYVRSKTESAIPRPAQLMLNFGFLDEELLEENQINDLNELSRMREKSRDVPILMETEFLSLVYDGKIEPSITEMGLNYQGYLREQEKHKSRKKKEEEPKVNENIKKVMYEIEQRLASTAAICSGSTATAFPILTSYAVKGNLKTLYTFKRKVEGIVKDVRNIDFSVFFRETVLKLGDAREIIQEEVIPYFIILPVFGTRTQLWQDLTGTNKRSRGRIVIPIFFLGDLKKSLVHTFACFRWELNRTIKGAMWGDPIDGGITGEYFDYVNTFKKMTKLSQEAKDKIAEKFKGLRTNRDRFADDYLQWVLYEKDGIMKQNNVVRDMFFRHIPFKNEIREKLESMPAFSQSATRYKNIHKRETEAYERKFKKYQDETGKYPPEIQKFMDFLSM